MEDFVNNTDLSFGQLTKKDGWFSRLIFIHLIVSPIYASYYFILRPPRDMPELVGRCIPVAFNLTIGLLLWKKRTRFTITVAIILLWIQFVFMRVLGLLVAIMMLFTELHRNGANGSQTNYRIYALVYVVVFFGINLVLNIVWTRNLRRLKSFCV
ncbi:MAG: hypothetical protein Q4G39_09800 [Brachymonas sp.]|nr:hypothetical protein [Brachymonas sp.]